MTDDDRISRRAAIKGIAVSGALVGGTAVGATTVSAGEKKDRKCKKGKHRDKKYDGKGKRKHEKKDKKGKRRDKKYDEKGKRKGKKGKKGKRKGKKGKKGKKKHGQHVPVDKVKGRVAFNPEDTDPKNDRAQFYIHHGLDTDLTFTYKVAGTRRKGTITVENDLATAETFWVKARNGDARVTVYYRGTRVGGASSDAPPVCGD
ncbi:hypothetical protein [Natrialba swarupiae]|uniref:Uncharacterized protein n=1 Tax=Natrialba swarupiae TaxID=2448032 RepID=A0A5D5ARC2_9EURY|nr:hypothetical protein [Natrialba swarupiae]TYT62372.1 hypothetical protein FYC77_09150 [Natrialba swarupiae]